MNSLGDFLKAANADFRIFDLGRRVQPIDTKTFERFESSLLPYPYPTQGHAHIGIAFWNHENDIFLWFLKLPLDEQGLIVHAARQQFLMHVIDRLGNNPTGEITQEEQESLADSPFVFKPTQEKIASIHAQLSHSLHQPESAHKQNALAYFHAPNDNDWQELPLQGIADVCSDLNPTNAEIVTTAVPLFPLPVLHVLCSQLEHIMLPDNIAAALYQRLESSDNQEERLSCFRGLAGHLIYSQTSVDLMLKESICLDTLTIVASRHWLALAHKPTREIFLNLIAKQDSHIFKTIFTDLVSLPILRHEILKDIQQETVDSALGKAIYQLNLELSQAARK